jgi:nitrile hydratase accessory protein
MPPKPAFDEPWQAQALALADAMVRAGHFTAAEWATALGAALAEATAQGEADTLESYYLAVILALEKLSEERAGISTQQRARRRADWVAAYQRTPHGMPVTL